MSGSRSVESRGERIRRQWCAPTGCGRGQPNPEGGQDLLDDFGLLDEARIRMIPVQRGQISRSTFRSTRRASLSYNLSDREHRG